MSEGLSPEDFVAALYGEARELTNLFVQRVGLEVLQRVVLKTPVDTGRARGGWDVGFGVPSSFVPGDQHRRKFKNSKNEKKREAEFTARGSSGGARSLARSTEKISNSRLGPHMILTNNVEYIEVLERGRHTASVSFERTPGAVKNRRKGGSILGIGANAATRAKGSVVSFTRAQGSIQAPNGMVAITLAEVERAFR